MIGFNVAQSRAAATSPFSHARMSVFTCGSAVATPETSRPNPHGKHLEAFRERRGWRCSPLGESGSEPNSSPHYTMDRTLYYDIAAPEGLALPDTTRTRIEQAVSQANERFTWSRGKLGMHLFSQQALRQGPSPVFPEFRWGTGYTRVDGDEWNAAIVVRFLRWVSTVLPDGMFIRLHDQGRYIAPGFVILCRGQFELDQKTLAWQLVLASEDRPVPVHELVERRRAGLHEEWVHPKKAARFVATCPELKFLHEELKAGEISKLTVDDAADRVSFPWDEEQQAAA